ncbi:hypothetical protein EAP59_26030 [Salmonella enterica]|nr:hypothetical protein [Salmonella enterica]
MLNAFTFIAYGYAVNKRGLTVGIRHELQATSHKEALIAVQHEMQKTGIYPRQNHASAHVTD